MSTGVTSIVIGVTFGILAPFLAAISRRYGFRSGPKRLSRAGRYVVTAAFEVIALYAIMIGIQQIDGHTALAGIPQHIAPLCIVAFIALLAIALFGELVGWMLEDVR